MGYIPNYDQALEILKKYNKEDFHIHHGKTVAGVMRYFANKFDPDRADFWEVVGLLHDLDFELYPEEHCVKQVDLMKAEGLDQSIIDSTIPWIWSDRIYSQARKRDGEDIICY